MVAVLKQAEVRVPVVAVRAAEDIRSGHHFDIDSRTISKLSSTSFIPRALWQSPFNRLN